MFAVYVKNLHECIIKRATAKLLPPPNPHHLSGAASACSLNVHAFTRRAQHRFTREQKLSDCRVHLGYGTERSRKNGSVS